MSLTKDVRYMVVPSPSPTDVDVGHDLPASRPRLSTVSETIVTL